MAKLKYEIINKAVYTYMGSWASPIWYVLITINMFCTNT